MRNYMESKERILFVDNGNYSRSPAAEIIARTMSEKMGVADLFEFSSGGVILKHVGGPADPRTIAACLEKGYDLSGFVCRQVTESDFKTYNRILAMDDINLGVFQFARRQDDKAQVERFDPYAEVLDPFYGPQDGFSQVIWQIEERVRKLLSS